MSTQSEALSAYVTTLPEAIGVIDRLESQNIALKKAVFELTASHTVLDAEIAKLREQEPVAWPETPEQVRDFVGGNFDWKTADEMNPSSSDKYCLTAHDLISAFECWSDTHQSPSQQAESELVSALAACRDAFPAPADGAHGDAEFQCAIADPLAVPEYVRVMAGQQSGYTAVDMSTAAADGYRDGREAMRQEIAGQAVAGGPEAWPCEIVEADFQHGEVLLAMNCTGYKVSAGTHYLSKFAPQAPAPEQTESVLIEGRAYTVHAAVAAEMLRLHLELMQAPAPAQWQELSFEEKKSLVLELFVTGPNFERPAQGDRLFRSPGTEKHVWGRDLIEIIDKTSAALREKNGGAA